MEGDLQSDEEVKTASEAEAVETVFARQREDHPLPAMQVLGEQREGAASGLGSHGFIP